MPNQTGPTSTAGKLKSCMNRLKHSGCSESLFIKGDNPDDFFALLENAFEQHQPAFDQDAILVTRSVRANWILMRRERAADQFESGLYERKPNGRLFIPDVDVKEVLLFDRYITAAHRAFTRALKDLQLIQKMARDDQRWQLQLAKEKEKIKNDPATAEFLASLANLKEDVHVPPEPDPPHIPQSVYAAFDTDGSLIASECSPTNDAVRNTITRSQQSPNPPKTVVRTYHFKGPVPAQYHWLLTNPNQRNLPYQEIRKSLTLDEWHKLTASE